MLMIDYQIDAGEIEAHGFIDSNSLFLFDLAIRLLLVQLLSSATALDSDDRLGFSLCRLSLFRLHPHLVQMLLLHLRRELRLSN